MNLYLLGGQIGAAAQRNLGGQCGGLRTCRGQRLLSCWSEEGNISQLIKLIKLWKSTALIQFQEALILPTKLLMILKQLIKSDYKFQKLFWFLRSIRIPFARKTIIKKKTGDVDRTFYSFFLSFYFLLRCIVTLRGAASRSHGSRMSRSRVQGLGLPDASG